MTEYKAKLIRGRVILALHEVLERKPTNEEIERYYRAARILYTTMMPTFFDRHPYKRPPQRP